METDRLAIIRPLPRKPELRSVALARNKLISMIPPKKIERTVANEIDMLFGLASIASKFGQGRWLEQRSLISLPRISIDAVLRHGKSRLQNTLNSPVWLNRARIGRLHSGAFL
jgi:hypothetical protein